MVEHAEVVLARAIREVERLDSPQGKPVAILRDSLEQLTFDTASVVPINVILARAVSLLRERRDSEEAQDETLVERWRESAIAEITRFCADPSANLGPDCSDFLVRISNCFGIEVALVPRLLTCFHQMGVPARIGVMLLMERSASFAYLSDLIDEAASTVEFDDPERSLRLLMRNTLGAT